MSTTRRWSSALAAGALAVTLAGCGGEEGTVTDPSGQAEGGSEAEAAGGADLEPGSEVPVADFIARLKSPGTERLGSFSLTLDMEFEGMAMSMEGQADVRGDTPQLALTMDIPQMGEADMIVVDGTAYLSMAGLTPGGKYIEIPAEELTGGTDITEQVDMTAQWDAWAQAQSITFVGTEDVDGEQLDHYQLVLDLEAALEASGQSMEDLGTDLPELPDTVTYEVWLDEDDLMRQVDFDLMGGTINLTMDDWGSDVTVEAPDPEDVTQMDGLFGP